MDYLVKPKFHYKPARGWMNDPNGLVYFKGYYHLFYQHCPNHEITLQEPFHWGHARTKDFLNFEELPPALYPDQYYDRSGCWSGTAIVKDDVLYLFYTCIDGDWDGDVWNQRICVAYSEDGINFKKYEKNPVIADYPETGSPDFRDPAVTCVDGTYYCVIASGHPESKKARLLLYKSKDLLDWEYSGIMCEWENSKFTECPSFMQTGDKFLLSTSVCTYEESHYFSVMYGSFENEKFEAEVVGCVDKGPDQYAGQIFRDHKGRCILMSWIPGWAYKGYAEKDVGCFSVPRQIFVKDGKVFGYPVEEVQHLLKDSDPAVKITDDGFVIERTNRPSVVFNGKINDIKIIRDEFILEVFINGGEEVYSVLL